MSSDSPRSSFADHRRSWRQNLYVYPVISRRSEGLSIGINLNPDKACNFDCIYCQVDRTVPPAVRTVDLEILERELETMLSLAVQGTIFDELQFGRVPEYLRRINDIAFSGDGEPTASPQFASAVELAIHSKQKSGLAEVKIVLITDACYLTRPAVANALLHLDQHQGEIWAKLDAGTEDYYQLINRPNYPLSHVMDNILSAAQIRPLVIQALFLQVHDQPPSDSEIDAFCERLNAIIRSGGHIKLVQVYTIARRPAVEWVTPLNRKQIEVITDQVRSRTQLEVESYYGVN